MLKIVYRNEIYKRIYSRIVGSIANQIKIKTHHNIVYSNRDLLEFVIYSSLHNQYLESTITQFSTCFDGVPSADTIFRRLNNLDWMKVLDMLSNMNNRLFDNWKEKPSNPVYLAVDYHDNPRYVRKKRIWRERIKRCDDVSMIVGTKAKQGTHYCHRIASIDLVEGNRYTLGFRPVLRDESKEDVVTDLINNAKSRVLIKAVLMDREFFNGALIAKLTSNTIPYVIRAIKTPTTERAIAFMKKNELPYYATEYTLNKNTHWRRRGKAPVQVKTVLVVVDNAALEKNDATLYDDEDRYFVFLTNLNVRAIDDAFTIAKDYRKRWGIETGYRVKGKFLAKTCSLSYAVRLFLILLSFILNNVWVLVNCMFKDNPEFVRIFRNHMTIYCMKMIFWIVLFVIWQDERG